MWHTHDQSADAFTLFSSHHLAFSFAPRPHDHGDFLSLPFSTLDRLISWRDETIKDSLAVVVVAKAAGREWFSC
jgi:hypothetical protein